MDFGVTQERGITDLHLNGKTKLNSLGGDNSSVAC